MTALEKAYELMKPFCAGHPPNQADEVFCHQGAELLSSAPRPDLCQVCVRLATALDGWWVAGQEHMLDKVEIDSDGEGGRYLANAEVDLKRED